MNDNQRGPPTLVPKVCPYCGAIWERLVAGGNADLAEIKCRTCKRIIRYRVVNGVLIEAL